MQGVDPEFPVELVVTILSSLAGNHLLGLFQTGSNAYHPLKNNLRLVAFQKAVDRNTGDGIALPPEWLFLFCNF